MIFALPFVRIALRDWGSPEVIMAPRKKRRQAKRIPPYLRIVGDGEEVDPGTITEQIQQIRLKLDRGGTLTPEDIQAALTAQKHLDSFNEELLSRINMSVFMPGFLMAAEPAIAASANIKKILETAGYRWDGKEWSTTD